MHSSCCLRRSKAMDLGADLSFSRQLLLPDSDFTSTVREAKQKTCSNDTSFSQHSRGSCSTSPMRPQAPRASRG